MSTNVYGIDLGTCNLKVFCKGTGKVINEKNTIAIVNNTPMLYDEAKRWRDFRLDVSRSYLVPRKMSG